jgi:hypothetical protein
MIRPVTLRGRLAAYAPKRIVAGFVVILAAMTLSGMQSARADTWFPAPSVAHGYGVDVSMPPSAFDIVGKFYIPREDGEQVGSIGPLPGYYSYVMCATGVYPVDLVSRNQDGEHFAVASLRGSDNPAISYGIAMREAGHRCTFYLIAPGRTVTTTVWHDWQPADASASSFWMAISGLVTA